ncbi:hypothetical protein BHE74_00002666 [Ensete ventricosum]|nr:hypothetical protein BHE74_00002666 [Ensete ventricosum]
MDPIYQLLSGKKGQSNELSNINRPSPFLVWQGVSLYWALATGLALVGSTPLVAPATRLIPTGSAPLVALANGLDGFRRGKNPPQMHHLLRLVLYQEGRGVIDISAGPFQAKAPALKGVKSMHVSRVVTGVNSSQIVLTSRSSVVTRLPLWRHGTPRQAELATKPPRFPFATALSGRVLPPLSPVNFYVADRRP